MNFAKPRNIFIVDDDMMLTEALKDYLTREVHHNIRSFATGEACLECINEEPDIVILDYYLDSVRKDAANGMEVLQTIKKHYPSIHVIMLSSQERYATAMQTIQKGAERYVIKGQDAFEEIAALVRSI